ncbi:MAG: DUF1013 domain-containing protein [Alphaproteobacteria bacterium]|nr:DUF1013 domain-containing protein [Alphaproteobacteria bacterium]
MAKLPLMPKATAAWLVDNTTLTFEQIAEFCGLHLLEVQAIADGDAGAVTPLSPITSGQLTRDEIVRAESNSKAHMNLLQTGLPEPVARPKGARYTPVSKRQDKPDAIAWILKNYPEVTDAQIGKLIGTTKNTITAVRERTHWNASNIRQRSPVELGICTMDELEGVIMQARKKLERAKNKAEREARRAETASAKASTPAVAAPEAASESEAAPEPEAPAPEPETPAPEAEAPAPAEGDDTAP